ncbi:N-6 DNA methylase [Clostridium sp. 'deep sea']|uniref:N-6 DNA methylase n=1 Tax=Clostridium sp. 'deep sea' TaxID=2779445 RepID=UPI0018964707|nr:N-6 DNA methylase [Clostridium sp. 'deep sea']QOR36877.1 N-6 DNA methylase [Clostridium sp. 'deep sea']
MYNMYERLLYEMEDKLRGIVSSHDSRNVISSILLIKWFMFYDAIILDVGNNFKNSLLYVVKDIEQTYTHLNGVLTTLLIEKIGYKKDNYNVIREIFNTLNHYYSLSAQDVKYMINHLLTEIDLDDDLFVTPDSIKEIMIQLVEPEEGLKVADYFTGIGSISLRLKQIFSNYDICLYGEEINRETYLISQLLMTVNEIQGYCFHNKDVYDFSNVKKHQFDFVFMDAPFSFNKQLYRNEVLSYGVPKKQAIDWANYQLALYTLKDMGKAVVTTTTGALFRTRDEIIRKGIVNDDKIEAVIQLPNSLYSNTAIETAIILFNNNKRSNRKNTIIFINASKEFLRKNRRQNTIPKDVLTKIISCIKLGNEIEGFSTIIDTYKVLENNCNLIPNYYINSKIIDKRLKNGLTLKEVAKVLPGVQISSKDMKTLKQDPTHYYLNVKNIQDNDILYDDTEKIREKKINWCGKYDIKAGDIIITTRGTLLRMIVVPEDYKKSFISVNLTIIRINPDKYNPYVLVKYLESDIGKLVLENITSGTTIKVINAKKLANILVPNYDTVTLQSLGERIKRNEMELKQMIKKANQEYHGNNTKIIKALNLHRL